MKNRSNNRSVFVDIYVGFGAVSHPIGYHRSTAVLSVLVFVFCRVTRNKGTARRTKRNT